MNNFAKGVFGTVIVNVLLALLLYALLHFLTDGFDDASESLIARSAGDDQLRIVLEWLGVARAELFGWVWKSLLISTAAAVIFLFLTNGTRATNETQRQSLLGIWVILLVVTLLSAILLWYLYISAKSVGGGILAGNYATILFGVFTAVFVSFYFSTALFVRKLMSTSVPGAHLFRRG